MHYIDAVYHEQQELKASVRFNIRGHTNNLELNISWKAQLQKKGHDEKHCNFFSFLYCNITRMQEGIPCT